MATQSEGPLPPRACVCRPRSSEICCMRLSLISRADLEKSDRLSISPISAFCLRFVCVLTLSSSALGTAVYLHPERDTLLVWGIILQHESYWPHSCLANEAPSSVERRPCIIKSALRHRLSCHGPSRALFLHRNPLSSNLTNCLENFASATLPLCASVGLTSGLIIRKVSTTIWYAPSPKARGLTAELTSIPDMAREKIIGPLSRRECRLWLVDRYCRWSWLFMWFLRCMAPSSSPSIPMDRVLNGSCGRSSLSIPLSLCYPWYTGRANSQQIINLAWTLPPFLDLCLARSPSVYWQIAMDGERCTAWNCWWQYVPLWALRQQAQGSTIPCHWLDF